MFRAIARKHPSDKQMPERANTLRILNSVLDGSFYDVMAYEFWQEREEGSERLIPVRERAPCVRYALCRIIVDDSVALLFGDEHFPQIIADDLDVRQTIADIVRDTRLPHVMTEAAMKGSIGSVAVVMRIINGKIFFEPMSTITLTPTWRPDDPSMLAKVTERYKVQGRALRDLGYTVDDDSLGQMFWFERFWDDQSETWMAPRPASEETKPKIDEARSVQHKLGFVPIAWIKNLPGPSSTGADCDGACTFKAAIDTSIEIDYQLSQAGRGLKYSAEPMMVLKDPSGLGTGEINRSSANAIVVDKDGDAKMLEISGAANEAVINYVKMLRELALESVHGNRSEASKLSAAQSGRAMELMNQGLVWLADRMRQSYGNGIIELLRMAMQASIGLRVMVGGKPVPMPKEIPDITLRWPHWYAPTAQDRMQDAQTLTTLSNAGHISRETAVKVIAPDYDIADPANELALIAKDEQDAMARAQGAMAQIKATETIPD